MLSVGRPNLVNYMRLHNWRTAKQYSAEYGKTWTKQIIPRTAQDVQLYGWLHNYPYHNQNDLTWWANRRRPRHTVASYALRMKSCSVFASLLRLHEETAIHQLSLSGGTTLLLPVDSGFSPDLASDLQTDSESTRAFLADHMILGELKIPDLVERCKRSSTTGIKTITGKILPVKITGSLETADRQIFIGSGRVVNHGIRCSNGAVVVVDGLVDR
jgi:uncharacterized surface protein with fasciclin (FAS1) repeats